MENTPQKSVLQSVIDDANAEKQAAEQENALANENPPAAETPQTEQENATLFPDNPATEEKPKGAKRGPKSKEEKAALEAAKLLESENKKVLSIFDDEEEGEAQEEVDKTDYKALVAQKEAELARYNKPFLNNLIEAMESPDFDPEKFFESFKPKDFKDMPVEELWKMKKKTTSNIDYTKEELDEMWDDERQSIEDGLPEGRRLETRLKSLKDSLISELKPKINLDEEPEYIKGLKLSAQERKEAQKKSDEAYNNMLSATLAEADAYLGGTVVGDLKVSDKHIEELKKSIDPASGYYKKADGSFDEKKLVREKLAAIVLKDVLAEHKRIIKAETKKEIHRPNANSEGAVYDQSTTTPEDEALNKILKQDYLKPKK